MAIQAPKDVLLHRGCLTWRPVPCADGYLIHLNGEYIDTVREPRYSATRDGAYSVSAFIEAAHTESIHSPRTKAKSLKMLACPISPGAIPDFVLNEFTLVFNEQFNEGRINETRWRTAQPWGSAVVTNNELQHYVDTQAAAGNLADPFSFSGSTLKITASPTPSGLISEALGQSYTSGVLTTSGLHAVEVGSYTSARIKSPGGVAGLWNAFWLYDFQDEIDVLELAGNPAYGNGFKLWQAYHEGSPLRSLDPNQYTGGTIDSCIGDTYDATLGWNLPDWDDEGFNEVGVLWEVDRIVLYLNGVPVNSICENITQTPKYMILNTAVGGTLGGSAIAPNGEFCMEVDSVVSYRRNGT